MCGQALGYETLALGLFVKLKSNVVRVHRLLSGFRQPCSWSKWASNHLEQKPFSCSHIGVSVGGGMETLHERTCVCLCVCLRLHVRVFVCAVCAAVCSGLSELQSRVAIIL